MNHLKTNAPTNARKTVRMIIPRSFSKKNKNSYPIWVLVWGFHRLTTELQPWITQWTFRIESSLSRLPKLPLQSHRKAQRQWLTSGQNANLTIRLWKRVNLRTTCRTSSKLQRPIWTKNLKHPNLIRQAWPTNWTSKWSYNKWSTPSWTQEAKLLLLAPVAPKTN